MGPERFWAQLKIGRCLINREEGELAKLLSLVDFLCRILCFHMRLPAYLKSRLGSFSLVMMLQRGIVLRYDAPAQNLRSFRCLSAKSASTIKKQPPTNICRRLLGIRFETWASLVWLAFVGVPFHCRCRRTFLLTIGPIVDIPLHYPPRFMAKLVFGFDTKLLLIPGE